MSLDNNQVQKFINRYTRSIKDPITKDYDTGYIDGVVDTLGDLIAFLELEELNELAEAMEDLQTKTYDKWESVNNGK